MIGPAPISQWNSSPVEGGLPLGVAGHDLPVHNRPGPVPGHGATRETIDRGPEPGRVVATGNGRSRAAPPPSTSGTGPRPVPPRRASTRVRARRRTSGPGGRARGVPPGWPPVPRVSACTSWRDAGQAAEVAQVLAGSPRAAGQAHQRPPLAEPPELDLGAVVGREPATMATILAYHPRVDAMLGGCRLGTLRKRKSHKWRMYPRDVLPAFVAEMDFDLAAPSPRP